MKHMVILSSSFSTGERIGYHIEINEHFDFIYKEFLRKMESIGADIQYSPYVFVADEWKNELKTNTFYKDVKIIENLNNFALLIEKGLVIDALNISAYILSKQQMTHLKLQKILFLSYQKYLKCANKKMFVDDIYAYKYGPVIKDVYLRFKKINTPLEYDDKINEKYNYLQRRSRILFAKDGHKMLEILDDVLEKYKDYSASDLVTLTHSANSAWSKCYIEGRNDIIIPDEIIKTSDC